MSDKPIYYNVKPLKGLVDNIRVYGLDDSVRRAKFPMCTDLSDISANLTDGIRNLALSAPGSGHDQWLTGIIVQFDLTFSNKAWVEMERYHFIDFVSSQSTMHRITRFDLDSAYNEYVNPEIIKIMHSLVDEYNWMCSEQDYPGDLVKKKYLEILYSNPAGFKLTAGLTTNYRQLKTIYRQRKDHRLPEWREFCKWMHNLPYSELIIPVDEELERREKFLERQVKELTSTNPVRI